MKRLVCLLVCATAVLTAAEARAQEVSFGVKGGLLRATLENEGIVSFDPKSDNGFTAGASLGIELKHGIRIQPELLFADRRLHGTSGSVTVTAKMRAFDVPLLLVGRGNLDGNVQPVFYAGPQFSYISKVRQSVGSTTVDSTDDIRSLDFGLTLGAGLEAKAGRGAFTLEGRINLGLRDLTIDSTNSQKTRALALMAGYRF
jgi:opacity protein-like surface antigen